MEFPRLSGLHVGDGTLREINVEPGEVKVIHCFKFDWIAEEVAVDEGLDGWVGKEVLVVDDEADVHIAVVGEMEVGAMKQVVAGLLP